MQGRDEAVELLRALVAANTVNPPGNEAAAAAVVADYFEEIGIPFQTYEKAEGRTNIIGSLGSGSPRLLVAGHLDTVPAGDGWTGDPFELRVDADVAYGRGANDNKAAMAGSLLAAGELKKSGVELGGTLLIAGVADEERGNTYGAKYLLEEVGLSADWAVVPDANGHMRELDVGEKGAVFLKITCTGRAAHGSRPSEGANAVEAMARLVSRISDDGPPSPEHEGFSPSTINVGRIEGGDATNMVPARSEAYVDVRILPGTERGDVVDFVRERAGAVERLHPGTRFEIEVEISMPPHEVPLDTPLAKACGAAAARATGHPLRPVYQGGVTLAKEFILAGIPAVALGPGASEAAHSVDEWIEIDEIVEFARFVVELSKELLPRG